MVCNVWTAYRAELTKYNIEVRKAKRALFRNYCGTIKNTSEMSRLNKMLKTDPINPIGTLLNSNGDYTRTGKETFQVLLDCQFPGNYENPVP